MGFRLIRVVLGGGARRHLQIMAEREDGSMNLDDCTLLSRSLSTLLDEGDPIKGSYVLEVSSPGIERPLCRLDDFDRWSGHVARIELSEPIEGRRRFCGRLTGVDNESIAIVVDAERIVSIPASAIARARLLGEAAFRGVKS